MGVASGGIFVGCGAIDSGQGSNPSESPTDMSRPSASSTGEPTSNIEATSSPTAVVPPTPKESVIPADAIRLDKLAARPLRTVTNKQLEAAFASVTSDNLMAYKSGVDIVRNDIEKGNVNDRLSTCEWIFIDLYDSGVRKHHDPHAEGAAVVLYDYAAYFITKAHDAGRTPQARVDLNLQLWDWLQRAGFAVYYR
jgi:hypothetical protein